MLLLSQIFMKNTEFMVIYFCVINEAISSLSLAMQNNSITGEARREPISLPPLILCAFYTLSLACEKIAPARIPTHVLCVFC